MSGANEDKLDSLVVCSGSGSDGCGNFCPHSIPHEAHKPKQTAHDGDKTCVQPEWCWDADKMVQCIKHNATNQAEA